MMTERKPTPLTDEQRDLARSHFPLALKLARPFKRKYPSWRDEFESAACLAIVRAAGRFDPSRGLCFGTLAGHHVRGHMIDVIRSMKSLATMARWTDLADGQGSELSDGESFEDRIRGLPADHRTVVRLHYLHGNSSVEIAEKMGVSRSEADRRHRSAIRALSPGYTDDGRPFRPALASRRKRSKARTNLQPSSGEKS